MSPRDHCVAWWRRRDRFTKGLAVWVPVAVLWIFVVPLPGAWPIPLVFWLGFCAGWGEGIKDAHERMRQALSAPPDELADRRQKARWN